MTTSGIERVLLRQGLQARGLDVLRLDLHGGEWAAPLRAAGAVLETHRTKAVAAPGSTVVSELEETWAPRWAVILADCLCASGRLRPRVAAFIVRTGRSEERRAALLSAVDLGDLDAGFQLLQGWLRRSPKTFAEWQGDP